MLKSLVDDLLYMIIRQRIIHDLGLSAEFDQSGKPECFQLVRDRRFGDAQQNRKVAYTHLALFQYGDRARSRPMKAAYLKTKIGNGNILLFLWEMEA